MKQSPSLVIDEYTEKCKKTLERSGSNEEVLRRTTARLGDEATWAVQERLLAAHARGRHLAFLKGDGALSLVTEPAGAEVWLFRYVEGGRRLRTQLASRLGTTPLATISPSTPGGTGSPPVSPPMTPAIVVRSSSAAVCSRRRP